MSPAISGRRVIGGGQMSVPLSVVTNPLHEEIARLQSLIAEKDAEIARLRETQGSPRGVPGVTHVFDREGAHLVISAEEAMATIDECQESPRRRTNRVFYG